MNGPQRLLETEGGSLAKALEQARGRVADHAKLGQVAEGLARQGVPIDPSAIPASAGAAAGGWSLGAKLLAGAFGVLALVALGTLLRPGSNPSASKVGPPSKAASGALATTGTTAAQASRPGRGLQPRSEQTRQPALEPEPEPKSGEPVSAPEATATSPSAPPALVVEQGATKAPVPAAPVARPSDERAAPRAERSGSPSSPAAQNPGGFREPSAPAAKEEEIALLKEARAALASSPAQALALTERHRADYPRGSLVQEREVIAITALARLGQSSSARQRADRFRNAYPRSAYLKQIERVLGDR